MISLVPGFRFSCLEFCQSMEIFSQNKMLQPEVCSLLQQPLPIVVNQLIIFMPPSFTLSRPGHPQRNAPMLLRPVFLKIYFISLLEDLACEVHRVTHGRRDVLPGNTCYNITNCGVMKLRTHIQLLSPRCTHMVKKTGLIAAS